MERQTVLCQISLAQSRDAVINSSNVLFVTFFGTVLYLWIADSHCEDVWFHLHVGKVTENVGLQSDCEVSVFLGCNCFHRYHPAPHSHWITQPGVSTRHTQICKYTETLAQRYTCSHSYIILPVWPQVLQEQWLFYGLSFSSKLTF